MLILRHSLRRRRETESYLYTVQHNMTHLGQQSGSSTSSLGPTLRRGLARHGWPVLALPEPARLRGRSGGRIRWQNAGGVRPDLGRLASVGHLPCRPRRAGTLCGNRGGSLRLPTAPFSSSRFKGPLSTMSHGLEPDREAVRAPKFDSVLASIVNV